MMGGVVPSEEFNRQLVATVRQVLRSVGQETGLRGNPTSLTANPTIQLSEDLAAAADGLDDASLPSASADFIEPKAGGGWQIDSARSITLFNRSESSYGAGSLGTWRMVLGKACFVPEGAGGGDGDGSATSSGCCCCVTLHSPNVELTTGEWTTTRRIPCGQIGDVYDDTEPNLEIIISFPPPESIVIVKESDSDTYVWTFDEADVTVTANYLDGATATVTSLDGTAVFTPHNNGRTELVISWTIVVPEQVIEEESEGVGV